MSHRSFDVADWGIGWSGWEETRLARRESVFSLANGHLGWRGTLDEGDPCVVSGAYLNGVHEQHPMPYAEGGYGYPDAGESVINVPDGKVIRLIVGDEPFDIRTGTLESHEQFLDFRSGVLRRDVRWTSPAGLTVRLRSRRLLSLTHRSVAAVDYEIAAVSDAVEVTVVSEIVSDEPLPEVHRDERVRAALRAPLSPVAHRAADDTRATLEFRTRRSGIGVAVAMDHLVEGRAASVDTEASSEQARTTVQARLGAGESLRLVKFVGHEWSPSLSPGALRDRVEAAVGAAARLGWDGLAHEQRAYLDAFWKASDVIVDGVPWLQQAVRFALFQVMQSAARAEVRSIPGKGLSGPGYEGHTFWDAEAFVLPVLTYCLPEAARGALQWRHSTLDHARARARQLHLAGAAFPWRTISGSECSGYWPAGTAAFHVSADISAAVLRYLRATGDGEFERREGVEILVETARLWMALGRWDDDGVFHLDGVTGPDEYSALVDDNVFTNLMAQRNLRGAAASVRTHPARGQDLGVSAGECDEWDAAAAAMAVPFDAGLGIHQQYAGSTERERWDFDGTAREQYPLQDHFPYFDIYRKQVVKQADLVLALHLAHEQFSDEETARAFAYYEGLTVRDSSLSAPAQSIVAARVGHLPLAMDYLTEAATIDLDDLRNDIDDGLHIAALAGVWSALVCGFGGMRDGGDIVAFAPRLASSMKRLSFGVRHRERVLRVDARPEGTTYSLDAGPPMTLRHFGQELVVSPGDPVTRDTPPRADPGPPPSQPRWRSPREVIEADDEPAREDSPARPAVAG
ncbi:glycosyl hydrolase family 65 protein [Microbacterium sp. BK668]|uniref:glycoside hydrolase family 65 protein n=1 Tax=Microbacterium sp. BK668 TaxID=2512118 RepID=UPI00105EEC1C|nr:glycosyl hydrolase family 65 protein [Microbacterium sp. BK668]TDN92997.1 alpha,alpha-trehalose phosphorylase [Microbacterium sp. BK668]